MDLLPLSVYCVAAFLMSSDNPNTEPNIPGITPKSSAWMNARSKSQVSLANNPYHKQHEPKNQPVLSKSSTITPANSAAQTQPEEPTQESVEPVNTQPRTAAGQSISAVRSPRKPAALVQATKEIVQLETIFAAQTKLSTLLKKTSALMLSSSSTLEEIFLKTEDHTTDVVEGYNELLERFKKCVSLLNELREACECKRTKNFVGFFVIFSAANIPEPLVAKGPDEEEEESMAAKDADSDDEGYTTPGTNPASFFSR